MIFCNLYVPGAINLLLNLCWTTFRISVFLIHLVMSLETSSASCTNGGLDALTANTALFSWSLVDDIIESISTESVLMIRFNIFKVVLTRASFAFFRDSTSMSTL